MRDEAKAQPVTRGHAVFGTTVWMYTNPTGWAANIGKAALQLERNLAPELSSRAASPPTQSSYEPSAGIHLLMHNLKTTQIGGEVRLPWSFLFFSLLTLHAWGTCQTSLEVAQRAEHFYARSSTLHVSERILRNHAIKLVLPSYPIEAITNGIRGTVVVAIAVDARGKVLRAVARSADDFLAEAAVRAALRSHFHPYILNDVAVPMSSQITYQFRLFGSASGDVTLRNLR